jgi:hypothetical protein
MASVKTPMNEQKPTHRVTTFGAFLLGVGLCFMLLIPLEWYYAWNYFYNNFRAEVESQGGNLMMITISSFYLHPMLYIPIFFGCILSVLGAYSIVRKKEPLKLEKPPSYGNEMLGIYFGFLISIVGILSLSHSIDISGIGLAFMGIVLLIISIRSVDHKYNSEMKKTKTLPVSPTSDQSKSSNQYHCNTCGYTGKDEYPGIQVSHCQNCGSQNIWRFSSADSNEVTPSPPTPTTIRIQTVEKQEPLIPPPPPSPSAQTKYRIEPLLPPPPPSEKTKYRSQFRCNYCGRSFWVFEHRLKIPYCCECGAPSPVFVATAEL